MNKKREKVETLLSLKLRESRLYSCTSQQELARLSGVGQSKVSDMESGYLVPKHSTVVKIVEALGLDVEEWMEVGLVFYDGELG